MRLANLDGRPVVLLGDGAVDVGEFGTDVRELLCRWPEFTAWAAQLSADAAVPYDRARLGPPVPRPTQVFAVALNYAPHAAEANYRPPEAPLVFTKFPTCVTGPDTVVELPGDRVDWEVELVAVIGRRAHRVAAAEAWSHIAGLTAGQDLSERRVQTLGTPPQFSLGKSYPGFGPIGPVLVTPDEFADPDDLELIGALNGSTVQRARTSDMIFSVPALVAWISAVCPLLPGDLIFTGTPAGVGNRMDPPRYLVPGDVLESHIEGIGTIRQVFTTPSY